MLESPTLQTYRMHDTCRTEKYYTATLLPLILFHNEFEGLRRFLEMLDGRGVKAIDARSIDSPSEEKKRVRLWYGDRVVDPEIITEMDVIRDVKFYGVRLLPRLKGFEQKPTGTAERSRPDVVIIVDGLFMVIEAKFFQNTSTAKIKQQILEQQDVIRIALNLPGYSFDRYCHVFLSARTDLKAPEISCQACLSWQEIRNLAEQVLGEDHYVTQRLWKALRLYARVTKPSGKKGIKNYISKLTLSVIIQMCRTEGDSIEVGYYGGRERLLKADNESLRKYRFKWDKRATPIPPKLPQNWIRGDEFLEILKDKGLA
jgi:hypothetical protein